jgi:hypothetical protein
MREHADPGLAQPGDSAPVTTRIMPGLCVAAAVSMLLIRAWANGLRRKATCAMRGRTMSSTNWPRPCSSRRAFGRGTLRPM